MVAEIKSGGLVQVTMVSGPVQFQPGGTSSLTQPRNKRRASGHEMSPSTASVQWSYAMQDFFSTVTVSVTTTLVVVSSPPQEVSPSAPSARSEDAAATQTVSPSPYLVPVVTSAMTLSLHILLRHRPRSISRRVRRLLRHAFPPGRPNTIKCLGDQRVGVLSASSLRSNTRSSRRRSARIPRDRNCATASCACARQLGITLRRHSCRAMGRAYSHHSADSRLQPSMVWVAAGRAVERRREAQKVSGVRRTCSRHFSSMTLST